MTEWKVAAIARGWSGRSGESLVLNFDLSVTGRAMRVLCIGAHSDDIEIGCGGTLLEWLASGRRLELTWAVLSGMPEREAEARRSARRLFARCDRLELRFGGFRDGRFPGAFDALKDWFHALAEEPSRSTPDVVFTHHLEDRHQDHRLVAELTWQAFRDHAILEYEVPKYEGDLGQPNLFVPLRPAVARRKLAHLMRAFSSQRSRDWFDERTFAALLRLRGVECRAESGLAEAFHARKLVLLPARTQ